MMRAFITGLLLTTSLTPAWSQSETFGNYVNTNTLGTLPLSGTEQSYVRQGGNSRTVPTSAYGPVLATGDVNVYANPSTGSDLNNCTTSGTACATFQHAVFVATQTIRYGINVGHATLHLADGTYNEVVDVPGLYGLPKWCLTCANGGSFPGVLEIAGDDSTPANVIVAAPSGACSRGGTAVRGGVIAFPGYGTYWLHGFTVTAVNEASGNYCADLTINYGAYVVATGTMDYGTASNGAPILNLHEGGTYKQSYNSVTMNVTAGTTRTGFLADVSSMGRFYADVSTINFIGSTTFTGAVYQIGPTGAWVSTVANTTYTGTLTSTYCVTANGNLAALESFNQGDLNETFAGCTSAAGARGGFTNLVGGGAMVGGMIVSNEFGTNIGAGSAPTVSTCGSGGSQVDGQSTDQSGHIVEGSGATACTVVFYNTYPLRPNCTVTPLSAATAISNYAINGSGSSWTGFTVSNSGGAITFDYTCFHHY